MQTERLSQPIQAESMEEHEKKLELRMNEIKLEYVDRLYSKKIPMLEEKFGVSVDDLASLLNRYTPVLHELMESYIARKKHEGIKWQPAMYGPVADEFVDKIVEFRRTDEKSWIEKTIQLLEEERKRFKEIPKEDRQDDGKRYIAGIINFAIEDVDEDSIEMSSIVKRGDVCISIHLESLFKNKNKNITSTSSLQELAVKIVDDFSYAVAVVARSWIMDTPIAKRMNFITYKRQKYDNNGSFWGQFINSNGQIDEDRVKVFLETGKAPFEIVTSAMKVEDFLRRYLPKERKGKIKLRSQNPDFDAKNFYHQIDLFRNVFRNSWDDLDEKGILEVFAQCPSIQKFNDSDSGRGFFDLLLKLKSEGMAKAQLKEGKSLFNYDESFKKFIASIKYVEKEVII